MAAHGASRAPREGDSSRGGDDGLGGMVTVTLEALGALGSLGGAGATLVSLPAPEIASTAGDGSAATDTSSVGHSLGATGGGGYHEVPVEEVRGAPGSPAVYALRGV